MGKKITAFIENMMKTIEKMEQILVPNLSFGGLKYDNIRRQFVENIEIIGEGIKKLSTKIKRKYRDIGKKALEKLLQIKNIFENAFTINSEIEMLNKQK
ncbi:MAG: hypothetical protein ACTSQY_08340 [Candidatus Odinarchaeia archaeon]